MKIFLKCAVFCIVCSALASALAWGAVQPSPMPANIHVIRIELGHTSGLCGGPGYCLTETIVGPFFIVNKLMDSRDKRRFPNKIMRRSITHAEWKLLTNAIDPKFVAASETDCRAAVDQPCSWVVIKFSNNSQINIFYNDTQPSAPISKLLKHIPSILVNPVAGKGYCGTPTGR